MGEGLHLRHVHISLDVHALGFLREKHGNLKIFGGGAGNGDPRRLDSQDLRHPHALKPTVKLLADPIQQLHVHLVIQKAVHLQHVPFLYDSIL